MITRELLVSLTPGAMLELEPLFPGLDKEPVVALVDKTKLKDEVVQMAQLSLHYREVLLGTCIVHASGENDVAVMAGRLA